MIVTSGQAHQIFDLLLTSHSDRYRAKLANDIGESSLLSTLTFAESNLQLGLYGLKRNHHYVVVMGERDGRVHRAWMLGVSYAGFCAATRKKFDSPHLCPDCAELLTSINHDPGKSGFAEKSSYASKGDAPPSGSGHLIQHQVSPLCRGDMSCSLPF